VCQAQTAVLDSQEQAVVMMDQVARKAVWLVDSIGVSLNQELSKEEMADMETSDNVDDPQ
jgi:hypothetical protein